MFKVRKLSETLIRKFNQWNVFHEDISIDESMVKYYGHHSVKQFICGKPVRYGYKNWVAACSSGYCYCFDIYCGKSSSSGYRATNTVRENRTKKCSLQNAKKVMKKSRAEFDWRFDKNNEILLIRWKDNSICTIAMAINYDSYEPIDEMDQSISLYKIGIHGKKWWSVLFTYMIGMALSNAWRLHVQFKEGAMKQIMAPRKKLTREEKLQKKREAERQRYQKIKNDPEKYKLQKQKEKEKYLKKKEKGLIKTVDQMTPREQRKARKIWKKKAKERRQRLALQNVTNIPAVPSTSDVDDQLPQRIFLTKALAAKLKSDRARRQRYLMIKKKDETINKLKAKVACYKKRLQRLRKREKHTPNSKVEEVMNSPCARETVKKKLLFAEVLHQQLKKIILPFKRKRKRIFKRVISGKYSERCLSRECATCKNKGLEYKEFDNGIQIVYRKWQPVSTTITDPKRKRQERFFILERWPVTQYRNKYMFYFLVTHLIEFYPAITHFTWNYHEAGHGKGAPDGVGAVCKRSADRLVGSGNDISSLNDLSEAIQKTCPNINVYLIDDMNILEKEALLATAKEQIKTFPVLCVSIRCHGT
ncbi:PiggyBac transposable element-derived protein 1 [Eumeta japonica]|uniref:PiggyBac transposable element-derived protein 1 n=2 Tax=Eumeta variegata TaxID=151549 RepID=A0A4C1Y1L2_EUMVA|nr:PiggyBac transposable element-derived protein 1 [Eumeta japonica]